MNGSEDSLTDETAAYGGASESPLDLTGIPETMVWTLFSRASEAGRSGSSFHDPEAVRILSSIPMDLTTWFGTPENSFAIRASIFDKRIRDFTGRHPDGLVVGLGEGLETQCFRCDNGSVRWVSVDLPEGIEARERFIPQTDRRRHISSDVLAFGWMEQVDASQDIMVTAEGLLVYLQPSQVRRLIVALADAFPGAEMVFDTIPHWYSKRTRTGISKTRFFDVPHMPWGINLNEIEPTLRQWIPGLSRCEVEPMVFLEGAPRRLMAAMAARPKLRNPLAGVTYLQFPREQ